MNKKQGRAGGRKKYDSPKSLDKGLEEVLKGLGLAGGAGKSEKSCWCLRNGYEECLGEYHDGYPDGDEGYLEYFGEA